ncbi:MAG: M20/M25/M40 family metallo-hydrolase [Phycisphaerales bacterium]|nr:MAG: M20/M25/M40 family metallo-hydrolase [Phycisphaerales bacterium]
MKVAIIHNKDATRVINVFGMQNKETYNPRTVARVAAALEKGGHNITVIDGNMHVIESLQHFMPRILEGGRMGMVFNMAYGIQGESRYTHVPSMLEMLGIPYVGSSPSGHALALDKIIAKIIMQRHQIPTPDFWVFSSADEDMANATYPVIVKPKMEAVSFGLRVAHSPKELREAVAYVVEEFQQQALAEQFIAGREFAVGLLGNSPVEAFPVLEIDLGGDPNAIQTVGDKRCTPREKICPAHISEEQAQEMARLSMTAFRALQLRDFARVDIRMDVEGRIHLLEINSMASLGVTGSYVRAASVAGYDYDALVNKMLDVAAVRYFATAGSTSAVPPGERTIPVPTRIRGFLRSRLSQLEALLKDWVNLDTYVRSIDGVNRLGDLAAKQLEGLGFYHQTHPQVEIGNQIFFTNAENDSYDILLLGNLDDNTKPSRREAYSSSETRLRGTGIWGHKGGLVAMIAALQALRFVRRLKKMRLGILLTSDDALQGRFAQALIQDKTSGVTAVLGLRGASAEGGLVTSRSGAAVYDCRLRLGETQNAVDVAHALGAFCQLIRQWTDLSDTDSGIVIAPFEVNAESNIMEHYAHGEAKLSVRFNHPDQFMQIDEQIRKLARLRKSDQWSFRVEGGQRRPPMVRTESVELLWSAMESIAGDLDIRVQREHRWSSADICFVSRDVPMVDGLGPMGAKPPGRSEYILRHSLLERSTLLAMTLIKLHEGALAK